MTGIALDHRLTQRVSEGGLRDLVDSWRMDEICVTLSGMAAFASSPSLGNKLRGALGSVLLDSASAAVQARRSCDWSRTSTAEIFFGSRPLLRLGTHSSEMAKPFVFATSGQSDGSLRVKLRVFGRACERTNAVADALVFAVRKRVRWSKLAKDGPRFLPKRIDPSNVEIASNRPLVLDGLDTTGAELVFLVPMDAERGDATVSPRLILERIVRRTALLAPWHGVALTKAYGDLIAAASHVVIDVCEPTSAPAPGAGGHHMKNRLSPPLRLVLSGELQEILPALAICETAHVGRGASLGLGRYTLNPIAPNDKR